MTYPIEKKLISIQQKPLINKAFIIAHESGNALNSGPNSLESEISYMTQQAKKGGPFTSHWVGEGGRIVQLAKTGMIQYGAGRKANPYAFAQVELARTTSKEQFKKDYAAYVWLLQKLAKEAQLPVTLNSGNSIQDKGIKTHHWVSRCLGGTNHTDPDAYFAHFGISISQFKKDIEREPSTINNSNQLKEKKFYRNNKDYPTYSRCQSRWYFWSFNKKRHFAILSKRSRS
ncbi:MAG: N-acetylmuramoyl-L-alanine amidase [Pisciglobus halotolerans]|nr:N-acetylmuramoyl-L-alanine amidase [Pisciglobus halotolerans]